MLDLLATIAKRTPDEHPYLGDATARGLRKQLAELPPDVPDPVLWRLHVHCGKSELNLGNWQEAIRQFKIAQEVLDETRRIVPPEARIETLYRLGVAYLRSAETQNCCQRNTPESCIAPIRGGGIHTHPEGSRNAILSFKKVLSITPKQSQKHRASLWMLNIAYMTLGEYPDGVPKPYLVPPTFFESTEKIPRFVNIAAHLGLDTFDLCGGAIADDFDNDGYLDIVTSTWDTSGQMRFFRNARDGTFTERTEAAGLSGLTGGLNMVSADYNNDGNLDILVLRGAWLEQNGRHPNSLLRNNGDGTFTDVTFDAGLAWVHYPTQTASWGDYDNDGDLDLYVGNESSVALYSGNAAPGVLSAPCQLFRNKGDGTFEDVADAAGVRNDGYTKSVIWGDYDNDRWMDLYVSNLSGANRLYHNNGDGTFTDVAKKLGVTRPLASFPSWFWDVNNDGALDILSCAYAAQVWDVAADALGTPTDIELACLYIADGRGGFTEMAGPYNLVRPTLPMGSNFGDLDNDGFPDFYLGTGRPPYETIMPNVMYLNKGGRRFAEVTYSGGFGHLQKGHGVVFADLDNDGDQDVFEQMGGALAGDRFYNALYENPGFGNHWISVKLVGVRSNRSAIGARIHVRITENDAGRSVYQHVNTGATFGANPLRQTIGLGQATRIDTLEVFWPTTGHTQSFRDVPLDRIIRIVEGESNYEVLELKKLTLGGQRG